MSSIDDLFRKPNFPPGNTTSKRKFEPADAREVYKSAKLSADDDAKGRAYGASVEDDEDDIEAGPELPPEEDDEADEEGRFFGGGVTRDTTDALDYLEDADGEEYVEEKIDAAWIRRMVTNLERKINKNSEQRARFESEPQKFMGSEADLDTEIKGLSILTEYSQFYQEFAESDGASHLVSLLAHENTDIAINTIQIVSELLDEDVQAEQEQWDTLVEAMLEADLVGLLISNLDRLDESEDSDRQGVYYSLAVLEGLASQVSVAEKAGDDTVLKYLLKTIQTKEDSVSQNKQYAAEVLQVLLQISDVVQKRLLKLDGMDILLQLVASYRKRDPKRDSIEEEYAENLFDALTCMVENEDGKHKFVQGEGMELMLIMLKEGKFSKPRALKVIDHATGGKGQEVCEQLVEAAGLKTIFGAFMKKPDHSTTEHLLGIFSALLRLLPGESASRIRVLGKFVEKEYEKVERLIKLRRDYADKVASADAEIVAEQRGLSVEERTDRADEWFSRRLDAGLYRLRTVDVILSWLVAEDDGARQKTKQLLSERDESLATLRTSLESQMADIGSEEDGTIAEMLSALIDCLK